MGKLTKFKEAEQLPLGKLLAEAGCRLVEVGDVVTHVDYPEFRAKVRSKDNGRCMLEVLGGWKGRCLPTWPVGILAAKLKVVDA